MQQDTNLDKNEIIKQFAIDNCSPKDKERFFVSGKDGMGGEYNRIKSFLGASNIFQSGSYARHTAITPLNDLDIFYVLPEQIQFKSVAATKNFLEGIATDLRKKYQQNNIQVKIETQSHSVCINFPNKEGDFTIDIVPAHKTNELNGAGDFFYIIPEISMGNTGRLIYKTKKAEDIQWIKTDPKGYKKIIRHYDQLSNNVLRRTVRIIKQWKHWQKDKHKGKSIEFKLKSFHLELITASIIHSNNQIDALEVLERVFTEIQSKYLSAPRFKDRASDQNNPRYIDDYVAKLSDDEKKLIKRHCKNALQLVKMAIAAKNRNELEDYLLRITRSCEEFIETRGFKISQNMISGFPFYIETKNQSGNIFRSGIVPTKSGDKLTFKHVLPKDGFRFLINQITAYYWKVRNTGAMALKENGLRGEITKNAPMAQTRDGFETTRYKGVHYVECYGVNEQSKTVLCKAICTVRIDLEDEIIRKQY
jgi:hypothetical protein